MSQYENISCQLTPRSFIQMLNGCVFATWQHQGMGKALFALLHVILSK